MSAITDIAIRDDGYNRIFDTNHFVIRVTMNDGTYNDHYLTRNYQAMWTWSGDPRRRAADTFSGVVEFIAEEYDEWSARHLREWAYWEEVYADPEEDEWEVYA